MADQPFNGGLMPKYSQNFLISHAAVNKITQACAKHQDCARTIEIGPGKGFLTRALIEGREGKLTLVEIDPEMVAHLNGKFPAPRPFEIINQDFLELDLDKAFPEPGNILLVSNLPYATGTAILQKILAWPRFKAAVLMFQKEVADRIVSPPGEREYGILSLSAQSRASVRRVAFVPRKMFCPPPKVDSAVVEFVKLEKQFFKNADEEAVFFKTIKAAFSQKRKTILNSLSNTLDLNKPSVQTVLEGAGIDPSARPETVSLEQYLSLSAALHSS
ncbi:MAG: 16S rRNA (adenine(1518)-N(6)/adenine(1519)-N(6))-dimethyltransferase RsmA [Elusimicrobiaceae bacterium]